MDAAQGSNALKHKKQIDVLREEIDVGNKKAWEEFKDELVCLDSGDFLGADFLFQMDGNDEI